MSERVFMDRGTCCVWISMRDGRLRLSGQELGGFMGTSEYEYFVTIKPENFDAVREVLGEPSAADIVDVMCRHADPIYTRGQTRWLEDHGIPFGFANWYEFDD